MNLFYGGRAGMNTLAENLSDRLGWVPTLGLCGGPEFGCQGDAKSCVGSYMYSCAVFTNIPVTEKFSGTGFRDHQRGQACQQVPQQPWQCHGHGGVMRPATSPCLVCRLACSLCPLLYVCVCVCVVCVRACSRGPTSLSCCVRSAT